MLAWSLYGRLNLYGALSIVDTDLDGLPNNIDSDDDNDGLPDSVETSPGIGTGPLDADSDDDGLTEGFEVNYDPSPPDTYSFGLNTDPLNPDTDNDGFKDGMEVAAGHDPLLGGDAPVWGDTDDNGVVNAADIVLLMRAVLGLNTLQDDQKARVDIAPVVAGVPAPDNKVTLGDLLVVERILLDQVSYPSWRMPGTRQSSNPVGLNCPLPREAEHTALAPDGMCCFALFVDHRAMLVNTDAWSPVVGVVTPSAAVGRQ